MSDQYVKLEEERRQKERAEKKKKEKKKRKEKRSGRGKKHDSAPESEEDITPAHMVDIVTEEMPEVGFLGDCSCVDPDISLGHFFCFILVLNIGSEKCAQQLILTKMFM